MKDGTVPRSYILWRRDIKTTKADYRRTKTNSECPNIMPGWRKHKPRAHSEKRSSSHINDLFDSAP